MSNAAGRSFKSYALTVTPALKLQMLNWVSQFNICCFMDSHQYGGIQSSFECLVAGGAWKWIKLSAGNAFGMLQAFSKQQSDWLFGHFGFDLKQETCNSPSLLDDPLGFPDCYFFVPEHLLLVSGNEVKISSYSLDEDGLFRDILNTKIKTGNHSKIILSPAMSREDYISRVEILKAHIHRGDCYEINFCQEFFAENVMVDPVLLFRKLAEVSPNPFSAYYKIDSLHLLCASPERYLRVKDGRVISQPIKGTAVRDHLNEKHDMDLAEELSANPKERSENVMVVDLVRNDLSRVCDAGSVQVDELFGVYSFPQVHQMISTISGKLASGKNWIDAVEASFPMGSMTGAPKSKVLELIERYELVRRGLFSGALGYCSPAGDADFNVVIRSILYNDQNQYLSCLFGSGITWYADPEKEYEECLLKAMAIKKVLE